MYSSNSENFLSRNSPSSWKDKDGKGGYVYKKSSYQYSTTENSNVNERKLQGNNVDQLDALLEDLKSERQNTIDRDMLSSSNCKTIERGTTPGISYTNTNKIITSTTKYDDNHPLNSLNNISPIYNGSCNSKSSVQYENQLVQDRSYDSNYNISTNMYGTNSKAAEINCFSEDKEFLEPQTTTSTIRSLENDLQNITLTDNILPLPGTKVTTTVRTYTYEVPADTINNRVHSQTIYNTIQKHENSKVPYPTQVLKSSDEVVHNMENISTMEKNHERPIVSNKVYEIREHQELNTTHNSFPHPEPVRKGTPGTTKSIVYKVNTTTNGQPVPIEKDIQLLPNNSSRYYYTESKNTTNTFHGPGLPSDTIYPPNPQKGMPYTAPPTGQGYVPPGPNATMSYKYSSTSTSNTSRGPDYGEPNHQNDNYHLSPFPVEGINIPSGNNPPQKVDELMQSFGSTVVDHSNIETPHRKRELETAVATSSLPHIPSVNKAGKEVYYPPGHDMILTKREEMMQSGSAGGGRWAKGSGMYEYESGYKSKSKTKTRGAMVPVCLPLCCAMPCSIM